MADDKQYRTVSGIVQFDPEDRDVQGKSVRSVVIQQAGGVGGYVYMTVWPGHKDVTIEKGDFIVAGGSYNKNIVDGDQGERTYHNVSVLNLPVRIAGNFGDRPDVVNAEASGDEPF